MIKTILRWVFWDERRLAFYEWDFDRLSRGEPDEAVVEWTPRSSLPPSVHKQLFAGGNPVSTWRMVRRWRQLRIRYFSLMVDGCPAAFGGIRDWSLERRECAWLGRPGPILGPAWTDPEHRGKGLHGRLLRHRLHICAAGGVDSAYTAAYVDNTVSRRNIERAGFRARGCVLIRRACFRLHLQVRPLVNEPASVLVDR